METIIQRIKALIVYEFGERGENAFAKKIGIPQVSLNNYTRGRRKLRLEVIEAVIQAFPNISAEWLLRGEGDMIRESPENERERIGRRIAETRKEKGLSQMQLSELTGITSKNIANIEAGKYNTEIDTLAKIAKALNCKIDFIQK
ncbi:helix-turn-helix transcriptional regulator [Bacteroides stercoris]|uniref:helix-turn-helix domain-containing protein n=1 Tax=Bacteroides stercoris TaxID=46506 RepID=UPI00233E69EB|nr:helix-turn-helix transcriptional regulator [Bacteroides stercoris]MDC2304283.1 helix-turn-helix transcriptional regulator [Bacteroides stercoris]